MLIHMDMVTYSDLVIGIAHEYCFNDIQSEG